MDLTPEESACPVTGDDRPAGETRQDFDLVFVSSGGMISGLVEGRQPELANYPVMPRKPGEKIF